MSDIKFQLEVFYAKVARILASSEIPVDRMALRFGESSVAAAVTGSWDLCCKELAERLAGWLNGKLLDSHHFSTLPRVRNIQLPNGRSINIALINQQAEEWYGREESIGSFDFLYEDAQGYFANCSRFLDLGGHQMVWAVYYAGSSPRATVVTYEPSVLNAVIGSFNCLINGVIDRVKVVPFAVSAVVTPEQKGEGDKMLVDFMNTPLVAEHLSVSGETGFDFVKVDIEGYEYEMLSDPWFVDVVKSAKRTHFELHLGHLIHRGIGVKDCVAQLMAADINGTEIYSKRDIYSFLADCDPNGYFAFCLQGKSEA